MSRSGNEAADVIAGGTSELDDSHNHNIHGGPTIDITCIIDVVEPKNLSHRLRALEEVKQASATVNANLSIVSNEKLIFRKTINVQETIYTTDVAIVDMSIPSQRQALFYNLGLRESLGMKQNIVLYNDIDPESTLQLKSSTGSYTFIPYKLDDCGACLVTDVSPQDKSVFESRISISARLKELFNDVEIQTKVHTKETFLSYLANTKENYSGEKLRNKLSKLRERLNDPDVLSDDTVYNMLTSFRDLQDYDAMIQLVEDMQAISNTTNVIQQPKTRCLYPFALHKRNRPGDREKALEIIKLELKNEENHTPEMVCLYGRIYKDQFVDSFFVDQQALENAIYWYRKGFEMHPNGYAGINLAALLIIDGKEFHKSKELQHIHMILNNFIGKKGRLKSLENYWDVATYFEISVLSEDYRKAIQAAECMFHLKPPSWKFKSTVGNILLINKFRKKYDDVVDIRTEEQNIFDFWMDYFVEATKTDTDNCIRFPVLVFEAFNEYMPCYVNVNLGAEEKSIRVSYLRHSKKKNQKYHEWLYYDSMIKRVNLHKTDDRCLFLYVNECLDEFQMYFPSSQYRQRFFDLVAKIKEGEQKLMSFNRLNSTNNKFDFDYELDNAQNKIVLGKGNYGIIVYRARKLSTQMIIAVKEVPMKNLEHVEPLHEIVKSYSQLDHRNILRYFGSMSQNEVFKIFMEEVPGGSLFWLLRTRWGFLKKNEPVIIFYTKQMLEGIKYLHDHKIVHRNIHSENILINTYDGVLKISNFGMDEHIFGLCSGSNGESKRTLLYSAPEDVEKSQSRRDYPSDIWSLGCTVVEMVTGEMPYAELGSIEADLFKMNLHKMHPTIPVELSDRAKNFLLRFFNVDPDRRPTAANLLDDPFMINFRPKISLFRNWSRSVSTNQ